MEITTAQAVDHLTKAWSEDEGFYYAYQSNIAMAFCDLIQYNVTLENNNEPVAVYTSKEIHELANKAAKNFLNLLINYK